MLERFLALAERAVVALEQLAVAQGAQSSVESCGASAPGPRGLKTPAQAATADELAALLRRVDHEIKFDGRPNRQRERAQRLVLWWWGQLRWVEGWHRGYN